MATGAEKVTTHAETPNIFARHGRIIIEMNQPIQYETVSVYSVTGALIAEKPVHEISNLILNDGIYLVKVQGSKVNHTAKVLVLN